MDNSRRDFLKKAFAIGGTVALAQLGLSPKAIADFVRGVNSGSNWYDSEDLFCWWKFENNLTDEKGNCVGGSVLTQLGTGLSYDSVSPISGSYSLDIERSGFHCAIITDSNLPSGFPMTSGYTTFTILGKFRAETVSINQYVISKYCIDPYSERSLGIQLDSSNKLKALHGTTGGGNYEDSVVVAGTHPTLSVDTNYAFSYTENGSTGDFEIRVYNLDSDTELGSVNDTWDNVFNVEDANFHIGGREGSTDYFDGRLDDIALFDAVISSDLILDFFTS
jgi:hypothetical protein